MKLSRLQKNKKFALDLGRKLRLRPDHRLELYAFVQRLFWRKQYSKEKYSELVKYQPISPSNFYYGHEYWLKKYSGFEDKIYAHIEHGVYFGKNRAKVADEEEWELGSIITYGDSRVDLLNELYPDFYVCPVGPRIHYAETDKEYFEELSKKIDPTGKVLTLYPAHSIAAENSLYDTELFLTQAEELAKRIDAKTIMVSLHPSDYLHDLDLGFKDKNIVFVGGGTDSFRFLPRLRAIFELSDLTFSNALGSHVGYSVYMGTPHVINLASNKNVSSNPFFEEEQKTFASVFNGEQLLSITEEQNKLCDYYFGFSYVKTPEELYQCLYTCKKEYEQRFKGDKKR